MAIYKVDAKLRDDVGKGASRRLRREGRVPVVLYGAGRDPRNLTLNHNKVLRLIEDEGFFSSIIEFSADGGAKQKVVLKDMQRHPAKPVVMHMDFMRVDDNQELVMNIPIHFLNADKCPAGKVAGIVIDYQMHEIEITCLPKDLPESFDIDLAEFEVGDSVMLSDIKMPEGVKAMAFVRTEDEDYDEVIVNTATVMDTSDDEDVEEPDVDVPTVDEDESGEDADSDEEKDSE
ncbi:50S ribosomal protein L25 [Marinicella pacifica]|jgi:large subunit ribosomal protein L25|uniref:Large ribosomal subunit protein bL25 n=1 Tax=Marinicella pacifica TaxID=1171543 RepID=A0A917CQF3_9GAMM|nr:50S ribosomal protein L25/general stress protein Ctc [Marinicella pacifica]GGF95167.1 50S ribosomal protein L25 [Marinicella pacifica]